jgi:hypothetical protein
VALLSNAPPPAIDLAALRHWPVVMAAISSRHAS